MFFLSLEIGWLYLTEESWNSLYLTMNKVRSQKQAKIIGGKNIEHARTTWALLSQNYNNGTFLNYLEIKISN